jgi:D-glycero-D-manno-heptose 1,7-bisphosphate phosphatase
VYYKNRVNAGIHILNVELLKKRPETPKVDLDRQILKPLAGTGKLVVYDSPEYVKDMGTPERYDMVCSEWQSGFITSRNLLNKQKAIFLDRDGTINEYVGFLRDIDDFRLLPGVDKAMKKINESGYLAIVITNQPVIARGEVTVAELEEIHNKMETLLGLEGAYIDGLYYCPHHPDKGFEGEVTELKINCDCRKPKPGMILAAVERYNIDLAESWMIGDDENDIKAGQAAGCKTALIGTKNFGQDIDADSLLDVIEKIM